MASKSIPFLILFSLILGSSLCPCDASENEELEEAGGVQGTIGEDLSGKTDAELFGMGRELQRDIGKDPGNADLHYRISTVYATLFDRTRTKKGSQYQEWLMKSRDALEKVLMIRPKDKVAHYNLGVVYKRQGQMERAREELRKAIGLCDPDQDVYLLCSCWLQIGSVYEEQGFFAEAKEAYLAAREFDYENPDIQEALRAVDAKRKEGGSGGGASSYGMSPMGSSLGVDPQIAAAMGQDTTGQNGGGIEQALPALGQMLMQKMGGGDSGGESE